MPSYHRGGKGGRNQERSGEEQNGAVLSGGGLNPKRILKGREVLRTAVREGVCQGTPPLCFSSERRFPLGRNSSWGTAGLRSSRAPRVGVIRGNVVCYSAPHLSNFSERKILRILFTMSEKRVKSGAGLEALPFSLSLSSFFCCAPASRNLGGFFDYI